MLKIPITETMLNHLDSISSLCLQTTLHTCLEKAGLLTGDASPISDMPRTFNCPENMRFFRKASCASLARTGAASIQVQVSGIYGLSDGVSLPIELIVLYSAQIGGKEKMTISIREQYDLQGEVESRVMHIFKDASPSDATMISATRKTIGGRVFFEMLKARQQLQLVDISKLMDLRIAFAAKEPMLYHEYKLWTSKSYAAVQPDAVEPVEIIMSRNYLGSGNKEYAYFTGTCSLDEKNWNGVMSITLVTFDVFNVLKLYGKILRKNILGEFLHDDHARFVQYRLITTSKGVPVYRADSFLPKPNNGLHLDETYITREDVLWTDKNCSIAKSSSDAIEIITKHQASFCFEKLETIGPVHEGNLDGVMTISDRWGKRIVEYSKNRVVDSFVGKFMLPNGQGEGGCSMIQISEQKRLEYAFYRESKTGNCGFLVFGLPGVQTTAIHWISKVAVVAPNLLNVFVMKAPIKLLLELTPNLLIPSTKGDEKPFPWPDVWFGMSMGVLPKEDLPLWLACLMPAIRELVYEDILRLLEPLNKYFIEKKNGASFSEWSEIIAGRISMGNEE